MKTTRQGIELIKASEGLRLKPYLDAVGKLTIGYGHLIKQGERFKSLTRDEAEQLFARDLAAHETVVDHLVTIELNDNQFSALVDFTFNLGAERLAGSTLLQKVNAGDFGGASCEFAKWVYGTVNGKKKKLPGLITRREAERRMFIQAVDDDEAAEVIEPTDQALELATSSPAPVAVSPEPTSNPGLIAQNSEATGLVAGAVSTPQSPAMQVLADNVNMSKVQSLASGGTFAAVLAWLRDHPVLIVVVLAVGVLAFLAVRYEKILLNLVEAKIKADPNKHNIEFVRKA